MVIGFKQQFVQPILDGTKINTIREDANRRWKPGIMMHMATGIRSKYYKCFKETPCISTERIFMTLDYTLHISIGWNNSRELYIPDKEILAKNDGFENFRAFEDYWYPIISKNDGLFSGRIIHWTDYRYDKELTR